MWKTIKVAYTKKLSILITVLAVVGVTAFWLFVPHGGVYNLLDILSSTIIVGFSILLSISISSYAEERKKILKLRKATKKSFLSTNEISCISDIGKVRELDEDSVFASRVFSTIGGVTSQKILMIVADGMGGHSKGEVASALGVATVVNQLIPQLMSPKEVDYKTALSSSLKEANSAILNYAMDHPECEGMGTTMTASILDQNKIYIGHVGDTRAYKVTDETIVQLTKDHSLVQELVDKGQLTEEAARYHPQKNVITRVVGVYADVNVDTYEYPWGNNEQLLICCDGLVNHVKDKEIQEITLSSPNTQEACKNLINLANDRGGKDNISIVLTPPLERIFKN
ncbi:MAG: Stp1/IreP family PP2C-type Ser/Thr phosphatase [Candidatus Bathyarchaeota archaeon]|nr:Stp1/IreP family PP2C-type Ser/Thr phosphatase [Candidatus Bathyarchaeota archaeon]